MEEQNTGAVDENINQQSYKPEESKETDTNQPPGATVTESAAQEHNQEYV
jgi:hypothetical protein